MLNPSQRAVYTYEQALEALQHYCAYQDRCHKEVRDKLRELNIDEDTAGEVITQLIQENYLNEERFARSFARGKFKMKRWGRYRIRAELRKRDVSDYCIKKGLTEIDEEEYYDTLCSELQRRDALEKGGLHPYLRRRKLADYIVKRGYEASLVWSAIDDLAL